jgi:hypothetical protein
MNKQPEPTDRAEVHKLANAVEDALIKAMQTSYRDDSPVPLIGTAPPVPQPGRPAMSSKATDDSVRMLCFGGMTLLTCGGVSLVMVASEVADPTVIGVFFGGLAALALAIARLLRRAGEAAPAEIHNHISGPVHVDQRETRTSTRGVWAKTNNRT